MSANGHLKFQGTNRATFVGTTSNIMFDTTSTSLGIGVTGTDHPSSNLYVTGNAYVSSNIAVGGVLTMGTVNVVARHDLEAVTALGNTTPVTLEFTNPTTSLVASGNVVVTGNVTADHFVGDGSNITGISSNLDQIVNIGNVTSNTVQFSNATTGFVTTANVEVGGELTVSGNATISSNLTVSGLLTSGSGGTETQITDQGISYKVHSFTSTVTTQITVDKAGFFECLVVAGGGAGGRSNAAGGGGGGVVIQRVFVHTGTYDVVVGAGNTNGVRDPRDGNDSGGTYSNRTYSQYPIGYRGGNSSVFGLLAIGGGNGGGDDYSGIDGGSGGGCADDPMVIPGRSVQNQEGSNGYGNRGGYTRFNASAGSGGGGAGEPGYDCDPDRYLAEANSTWFLLGRDGGNGVGSTIRTGSMQHYGGGGGGADRSTAPADQPRAGVGGKGGGGNGGSQNGTGSAGTTNTGGGGGGTSHNSGNGGNGGSGIVVVRYKI